MGSWYYWVGGGGQRRTGLHETSSTINQRPSIHKGSRRVQSKEMNPEEGSEENQWIFTQKIPTEKEKTFWRRDKAVVGSYQDCLQNLGSR